MTTLYLTLNRSQAFFLSIDAQIARRTIDNLAQNKLRSRFTFVVEFPNTNDHTIITIIVQNTFELLSCIYLSFCFNYFPNSDKHSIFSNNPLF